MHFSGVFVMIETNSRLIFTRRRKFPSMDKLSALKKYFGYTSFRPGQESLIDALLQGRDVLGIMPTGAGKSRPCCCPGSPW